MKLKLTKAQLKALQDIADVKAGTATAEQKANVKNLFADSVKDVAPTDKKAVIAQYFKDLLNGSVKAGINGGSLAEGGVLIPVEVANEVIEALPLYGFLTRNARVKPMASNEMRMSSVGTGISITWGGEQSNVGGTEISFAPVTLLTKRASAIALVTNEEVADATVDIVELMKSVIAASIASDIDRVAFAGQAGVYTGLNTKAGVGAVTASIAGGDTALAEALIDLQTTIASFAAANGVYVTTLAGWGKMRKLKTANGLLARASEAVVNGNTGNVNSNGQPIGTFDGRPVFVIETGIDNTFVATKIPYLYGDFRNFFVVGIRNEMDVYVAQEGIVTVSGTDVNLLKTNQKAVRVTSRIAMADLQASAFARLTMVA